MDFTRIAVASVFVGLTTDLLVRVYIFLHANGCLVFHPDGGPGFAPVTPIIHDQQLDRYRATCVIAAEGYLFGPATTDLCIYIDVVSRIMERAHMANFKEVRSLKEEEINESIQENIVEEWITVVKLLKKVFTIVNGFCKKFLKVFICISIGMFNALQCGILHQIILPGIINNFCTRSTILT
jgi:hypothetical protein